MADLLNKYSSVFTKEDTNNLPLMLVNSGFSDCTELKAIGISREKEFERLIRQDDG